MKTFEAVQHLKTHQKQAIIEELNFLEETTLLIKKEKLIELLKWLKQTPEPGFEVLMDLTGVDYLKPLKHTKVVYWLHNPSNFNRLRLAVHAARGETVPSVVSLWEGANWYERELFDLFGVSCEGHPELKRILLPDDWQGHPLQKDYALTEEAVEFKHGVKPKVPSEIIPYVASKKNV